MVKMNLFYLVINMKHKETRMISPCPLNVCIGEYVPVQYVPMHNKIFITVIMFKSYGNLDIHLL